MSAGAGDVLAARAAGDRVELGGVLLERGGEAGEAATLGRYAPVVRSHAPTCRRDRKSLLRRMISVLRFRHDLKRCGDFLLEDPPGESSVREPRRPRPFQPSGAIALELPKPDSLS